MYLCVVCVYTDCKQVFISSVCGCVCGCEWTFGVVFLLSVSEEVDDVFGVGHAVHKLLTEAVGVEGLKTP